MFVRAYKSLQKDNIWQLLKIRLSLYENLMVTTNSINAPH